MTRAMIKQYTVLIHFLSLALGPDYEIALHDASDKSNSIVAIANGYISGRTIGAPMTSAALRAIAEKSYADVDYRINYSGISNGKKMLRSSTMYLKDESGKLLGLLCINFDDSRYQELSTRLFQLCHPDAYVDRNIVFNPESLETVEEAPEDEEAENFLNSITAVTKSVLDEVVAKSAVPINRLTQDEKMGIVDLLNQKGVFMLKGAVSYVAKELFSSQASIYRYLSKLNRDKKPGNGQVDKP